MPAKTTLSLLLACCFSASAFAQCAITSRWGERGFPADFSVAGDVVVAADGRGVAVYDISNPRAIRQTGSLRTNGQSLAIESTVAGEVILTTAGVELIRVAGGVPARLFDRTMEARTLSCEGALCAAAGADLQVFRVGESGFEPLAFIPLARGANAVLVRGGRIYVGTGGISISVYEPSGAAIAELQAAGLDFAASAATIFAASGGGGLTVIDPSVPSITARHFVGELDLREVRASSSALFGLDSTSGGVIRFEVANGIVVPGGSLDETPEAFALAGERVVIASPGRPLRVFDGATFTAQGEFEDRQGPLTGVATDGVHAFVADPPLFRVIDVRDRLHPREVASIPIEDGADRVRLRDNLAIVYGRANVHLVDVSQPTRPRYLGVYRSLGTAPNDADFAGHLLIEDNRASGFHVLDISDPADPRQIGGLKNDFNGQFSGVVALPGVAYGFANRGLKVIDLADPRTPNIAQFIPMDKLVAAEISQESSGHPRILLAIDGDSVRVFDLSAPLEPRELAPLSIPGGVEVAAGRDVAYVGTAAGELVRIDLSTGVARITHTVKHSSRATQIAIAPGDSELAVADSNSVVWMRDLAAAEAQPGAPVLAARVQGLTALLSWNGDPEALFEISSSADPTFTTGASSVLVTGDRAALEVHGIVYARVRADNGCSVSDWSNVVSLDGSVGEVEFTSTGQHLFSRGGAVIANVAVANRSSSPATVTLTSGAAGVTLPTPLQIGASSSAVFAVAIDPSAAGDRVELGIAGTSSSHLIEVSTVTPAVTSRTSDPMFVLPGMAATPGAKGTTWKSDLNLFCRGPQPCSMEIAFSRYGTLEPARSVTIALRAGEATVVQDSVVALFGASPAAGAFEIRSAQLDQILASAFTYNEAPGGRFGQRISGVRVAPGSTSVRSSRLHGISHDQTFRTNVGLVNASPDPQRVVLKLGQSTANVDLRPWEGLQHPIDVFFPGATVAGDAILAVAAPQVVMYQSRVDQRTGDGTFSVAQPLAVSAEGSRFVRTLTVAVKTPGALGTFWRSALQLANDSASAEQMEIIFIPAVDPSRALSRTLTMEPAELFETADLFDWLNVPAEFTYGSVRVESAGPFTGWSRIYNDAPTGTYGQFVPLENASPASGARYKTSGVSAPSALQIFPVEETGQRRTNFGVAEVAGRGALLEMTIFDAAGAILGTHERYLSAFGSQVLFDILAPFRGAGPLRVQIGTAGDGELRVYGSTVEASTGDAVFIPAE